MTEGGRGGRGREGEGREKGGERREKGDAGREGERNTYHTPTLAILCTIYHYANSIIGS